MVVSCVDCPCRTKYGWPTSPRYDPTEDRWAPVTPMSTPRIGVGVAVVRRLLYAVGGYDGQCRLSTVECYDPDRNIWFPVASMNSNRSGAGQCCYLWSNAPLNQTFFFFLFNDWFTLLQLPTTVCRNLLKSLSPR